MGLTIHYELGLSADITASEVKVKLQQLQEFCKTLSFKEVGDIKIFSGDACNYEKLDKDNPDRWLLIQSQKYVNYVDTYNGIREKRPEDQSSYSRGVDAKKIIAFSTWPGEGCEEANFGLCIFPKTIIIESRNTSRKYRRKVPNSDKWIWGSFCKTQYANHPEYGGVKHFLKCHIGVIKVLDKAKELGFEVNVSDEGEYYTKRDVKDLIKEIGEWDSMIAAFGGMLKDITEGTNQQIEAAIFEKPNFEHLEMKGQKQIEGTKEGFKQVFEKIGNETSETLKTLETSEITNLTTKENISIN